VKRENDKKPRGKGKRETQGRTMNLVGALTRGLAVDGVYRPADTRNDGQTHKRNTQKNESRRAEGKPMKSSLVGDCTPANVTLTHWPEEGSALGEAVRVTPEDL